MTDAAPFFVMKDQEMCDKSVLLVDDEQSILRSLGNYLEKNSIRVQAASSGAAALKLIKSTNACFDVVITDVVMPGIQGLDLLHEIKQLNNETGVFILTGYGDMSMAISALQLGADDFILKPFDAAQIVCKIEKFFEKQNLLRKIKIYEKVLPICMYCKKIRDDSGKEPGTGEWIQIEDYLRIKSGTNLSHGCCPECFDNQIASWEVK